MNYYKLRQTHLVMNIVVYYQHNIVVELLIQLLSDFCVMLIVVVHFCICIVLHLLHICTMHATLFDSTRTALSFA